MKRLVLCLDGTWNTRNSNTNVFHLHNFVADEDPHGIAQLRYYDQGVGTGTFDYLSGGAFGFGVSDNVIAAYEWLIENYDDGDEIYLFGFSRGAFTARSLVGLIMKCGLLYPGAPLTVDELWDGYRLLGLYRDPEKEQERPPNLLERIFGREQRRFRALTQLRWDTGKLKVPQDELTPTERLLIQWSRRIKLTCVGVFDTVGAMGWDALGIPWLRTRVGSFYNTNPSTLIEHGFHALAVDEHRFMFRCVPWRRYTRLPANPDAPDPWPNIEQRWFTGAHANIGGGYEDNPLALFPLAWMMKKAGGLGLAYRRPIPVPDADACLPLCGTKGALAPLRDSYAEFLGGFWKLLTLGRPYFRRIAAPPRRYATYELSSVHEVIDESVWEFWRRDPNYRPKNLVEHQPHPAATPAPSELVST